TCILPGHTAAREVVLVTRPVDEDIDVVGTLRPSGKRLSRIVDVAALDPGAWDEAREAEKISVGRREIPDLLGRDIRRHFRRFCFSDGATYHNRGDLHGCFDELEVGLQHLANSQLKPL